MAPRSSAKENRTLRKRGGIFYTPPDICDFITRNAITAYLLDQIGITWSTNADPPSFSQALSRVTEDQLSLAIIAVKDIKILDPACGEGALLVAACNILLEFSQQLQSKEDPQKINRRCDIVARNIYGVDLLEENVRSTQRSLAEWVHGTSDSGSEHVGTFNVEDHVRRGHALLGWSGSNSEREMLNRKLLPFPWAREFPAILNAGGFDIIVANPPYGNLLTEAEIPFLKEYRSVRTREIAAVFLERCFQLVRRGGHLGLIIANSIAINASTAPARELLRFHMSACRMALFGTRPGRLFPDAEIRAMLLFGKKDEPLERGETGTIFTTDARKFFQRERASVLKDLHYESTAGIELGTRAIGEGFPEIALPKVGVQIARQILVHLKDMNHLLVRHKVNQPGFMKTFEIRTTGGYWLTALPKFPYFSSKIHQLCSATLLERDFLVLLANSALFYLFWSTYSNLRDLKIADFLRFPFPASIALTPYTSVITDLATPLADCLLKTFEPAPNRRGGRRGEFHPGRCKSILDAVDDLICTIYGFSSIETNFIKSYDNHLRRET